jgi:hypothetical protein
MPMPTRLACFLALVLAAVAPAARAMDASLDFYISGFRVGLMTLGSAQDGSRYTATGRLDPTGLIALFSDYFFDGTSTGQITGEGRVLPVRYDAVSKSPRRLRNTVIEFRNGTPFRATVEPPRSTAPDPAAQRGALDPVSAGFRLFRDMPVGEICNATVDVFDGSRRSRLRLAAPVESGGLLTCAGAFSQIEGEAHSAGQLEEFPFQVSFRANGAGIAQIERIEAPTRYGRAVLSRQR